MPARRVTRREAEAFLRRLEGGRECADQERLVREHRECVNGTRDRDADFGEEEGNDDAPPRLKLPKGALSDFFNILAKTPRPHGKSPVAPLDAGELAEKAADAESESDDDRYEA
ncbi:hypothetical protein ON010_g13141 [Phytophthora cinnamomi]|nr:hypothetical protein ON010_g13141 [Phytophthora cinnamomi]